VVLAGKNYIGQLMNEMNFPDAKIGRDYKPEQLIFMDEAAKDERSLSRDMYLFEEHGIQY